MKIATLKSRKRIAKQRKSAMREEPTTIMAGLSCGHASYVSKYRDSDGKPQCIDCANKMRGLA